MNNEQYIRKWSLTISPSVYDIYNKEVGYLSSYTKISHQTLEKFEKEGEIVPKDREAIVFTDPLKIDFRASKRALADPDLAEITLWNLSPELEAKLLMEGAEITLEAGYENGNYGVIYKGEIIQPLRGKANGTDYYTKFVCLSEDHFWNLAFVQGVIAVNTRRKQLIEQILRSTYTSHGLEVEDSKSIDNNVVDGSNTALERPKVLFGNPRDYIRSLAKMSNVSPYIEENKMKFLSFDEELPKSIHKINVTTGMIGCPTQSNEYISVKTLLNSSIKIGDYVQLDNRTVSVQQMSSIRDVPYLLDADGIYKVIGIDYEGDSRGNTWYSTLKMISKNGRIAAPLTNGKGELLV